MFLATLYSVVENATCALAVKFPLGNHVYNVDLNHAAQVNLSQLCVIDMAELARPSVDLHSWWVSFTSIVLSTHAA